MTTFDLLNNQDTVVYQKEDGIIGDKIVSSRYPGFKVILRDMWLNEGVTPLYVAGFVEKNGQVYTRPTTYKVTGMKDAAQQLASSNATSNPAVANLMTALVNLIDAYFVKFPQTTTYRLLNRNQPITTLETELK